MSYWSTVYAGDAAQIIPLLGTDADVEDADFVIGSVELSGVHDVHLETLMQMLGDPSLTFDSLAEPAVGSEDDAWVAYRMKPAFAALFAALGEQQIADLVPRWLQALGDRPNADSIAGCKEQLGQLVEVCKTAQQRGADIVFSCWS
ncbi:MAG TPA: hypothetical protein VIV40_28960 [Kofleriaceae bacterium]